VCWCDGRDSSDVQSSLMCDTQFRVNCTSFQFLYCGYVLYMKCILDH